jgi:hypothetical protein
MDAIDELAALQLIDIRHYEAVFRYPLVKTVVMA